MEKYTVNKSHPIDAVFFDCDGTLSQLEGINYLAELNGVGEQVNQLTDLAMNTDGISRELYQKRLDLVQPSHQDMLQLASAYDEHRSLDALEVIRLLHSLDKAVYVISAGNNPSVSLFAKSLGVAQENVFCVDLMFDEEGGYITFDEASPLVCNDGKAMMIRSLRQEKQFRNALLIGDGMNDCRAIDEVEYFVGYGGNYYRENVAELSDNYISTQSLLPLLPIVLSDSELNLLSDEEMTYYDRGLSLVKAS